jgi:hypothetical protein
LKTLKYIKAQFIFFIYMLCICVTLYSGRLSGSFVVLLFDFAHISCLISTMSRISSKYHQDTLSYYMGVWSTPKLYIFLIQTFQDNMILQQLQQELTSISLGVATPILSDIPQCTSASPWTTSKPQVKGRARRPIREEPQHPCQNSTLFKSSTTYILLADRTPRFRSKSRAVATFTELRPCSFSPQPRDGG